jgi:hypothetical protein
MEGFSVIPYDARQVDRTLLRILQSTKSWRAELAVNERFQSIARSQLVRRLSTSRSPRAGSGGGVGKSGGGGKGGGGGGSGGGSGNEDSWGKGMDSFGFGALWTTYLRLLESHPLPTKVVTSASINGFGDILGQALFEKDKPFDFSRCAKFTFLVCLAAFMSTLAYDVKDSCSSSNNCATNMYPNSWRVCVRFPANTKMELDACLKPNCFLLSL